MKPQVEGGQQKLSEVCMYAGVLSCRYLLARLDLRKAEMARTGVGFVRWLIRSPTVCVILLVRSGVAECGGIHTEVRRDLGRYPEVP